jgi:hypothetical protein
MGAMPAMNTERQSAREITADLELRLRARFAPPAYAYLPKSETRRAPGWADTPTSS